MSCPQEPVPVGWKVWRQAAVPDPLTQLAIDVRDHILSYPYGSIAKTVQYGGQTVGVFVSHHVWTYRNGVLITGICIPGASLIVQQPAGTAGSTLQDSLATPDPTAAVYGADDLLAEQQPVASTNWPLVIGSGVALVAVVGLFAMAMKHGGRAAMNPIDKSALVPGAWIEVLDPNRRVSYGSGGRGFYQVVKAGRVNVRASTDVRFSPTGPWFHQEHTIPLAHVVRVVPTGEIAKLKG